MPLPDEIFMLEAKDVCIGPYFENHECRCLLAWTHEVIDKNLIEDPSSEIYKIRAALRWAKKTLKAKYGRGHRFVTFLGDDVTPKVVARIWNLAWAKLGYTEGNPESQNLPKTI